MQYLLLLLFIFSGVVFGQNKKIDSLNKVIETTKVDTVKGRTLCRLCVELTNLGEFTNGLSKGQEGLVICTKSLDKEGRSICYNNIGVIYNRKGDYPQALEYFRKNLKIGDQKAIALSLGNIGIIYFNQRNYPKALEYFQKNLKITMEIDNKSAIAHALVNIGSIYNIQGNYAQSSEYFQKSLRIREEIGDKNGTAWSLRNLGIIYDDQGNYLKALEYYQKSLKINREIGDKEGVSHSLCVIGNVYLKMNQPQTAKLYARKGLALAVQINLLEWMRYGADINCAVDSALGDYKSAFEHHKLFKQYSDSLNNEDKAKEFGKIESKYEFEKQAEAEKRTQQEKEKIEAAEKERRDNLQYLTIFAGIIGLFTGLLFIGKLKIPTKITEVLIFAGLLITFEFLLIFFDPYFERYSGGIPFYKLGFNTLIAFGFAPLHSFLESKLKRRLVKSDSVPKI